LTAANLLGMVRERIVGLSFTLFVSKENLAIFFDHLRRCRLSLGETVDTELGFLGKENEKIPIKIVSVGTREADKILYQTTLIDIRARTVAELTSQEGREYAERIIQTVNQPLLVLDENLVITLANPAFYRVFKVRPNEVNSTVFQYAQGGSESVGKLRARLLNVIQQQKGFEEFEFRYKSPDGYERILLLDAQPLFRKTHLGALILLSIHDITERHEAEAVREHLVSELGKLAHELEDRVDARTAELKEVNAKLQSLSARMLEAQELERRHLARELHDEIGQQITCLQILTEHQSAIAPPPLKLALKETRAATTELLQTVRQLSSDLRPQLLDDFGVLAALEWHFKRFRKRTGVEIQLNKKYFRDDLLNSFLRNVLFRVAQEALTNVARHAHTNKVKVELSTRNGVCTMEVRDKGRGFDVTEALQKGSFGLAGMQERVFLAGGKLKFDSAPGKGTSVAVELPLVSHHLNAFDAEHLFASIPSTPPPRKV
jgi:PAS domain S-box-containing protein